MQFLSNTPALSLSDQGSKYTTYCAEMFQGRPCIEQVCAFHPWAQELNDKFTSALAKPACPVAQLLVYLDDQGAFIVASLKLPDITNNARKVLDTVLKGLPEEQRRVALTSLHPLDELDKQRLEAMRAVTVPHAHVRPERPTPTTLQAFLEDASDSEEEGVKICVPLRPQLKALTDDSSFREEFEADRQRYVMSADVVLIQVGEAPLTYVRCYKECRREALIAKHLGASPTLLSTVKVAVAMSKLDQLPSVGAHGRKTEFMRRCKGALKFLKPDAETEVKKLSVEDQRGIAASLDTRLCALCAEPATICEVAELLAGRITVNDCAPWRRGSARIHGLAHFLGTHCELFEPIALRVPAPGSVEPPPMCDTCRRFHTCGFCGLGDRLNGGRTSELPHRMIAGPMGYQDMHLLSVRICDHCLEANGSAPVPLPERKRQRLH